MTAVVAIRASASSSGQQIPLVANAVCAGHDLLVAVLASGHGADGASWELDVSGDASGLRTTVNVTLPDGRRPWGGGIGGGPALEPSSRVNAYVGASDEGPRTFIARVAPDVRAVVVRLSDGTREDLTLHGDAHQLGARVAVLVYPRHLDIHRVDLYGEDGETLSE